MDRKSLSTVVYLYTVIRHCGYYFFRCSF